MTDEATSTPERRTQRLEKRLSRERRARLEAESIAERATRDLSRINLEYQKLFDLSLNLLCTLDSSLNFRELNPAWEHLLGWTHEELRSRPALEFVNPDDLARAQAEAWASRAPRGVALTWVALAARASAGRRQRFLAAASV